MNSVSKRGIAALLFFILAGWAGPAPAEPKADHRVLTIDGAGEVLAENDSAVLQIGVLSTDRQLERAVEQNAQKIKAVLDALNGLRIKDLRLRTAGYNLDPQYDWQSKPPKITGYQARGQIEAVMEKINSDRLSAQVTKLMEAALARGANDIGGVSFYRHDRQELEAQALAQATQRALAKAKTVAQAAEVKLKHIREISARPRPVEPVYRQVQATGLMFEEKSRAAAPPMEAGQSRITAEVTVVYEIQ